MVACPPIDGHSRWQGGSWWHSLFRLGPGHLARQLVAGLAGVRHIEAEEKREAKERLWALGLCE
jgi:hypothetical protein